MGSDPDNAYQKDHQMLADICRRRMSFYSLLISSSTTEERKEKYQRDFNNYKYYEI